MPYFAVVLLFAVLTQACASRLPDEAKLTSGPQQALPLQFGKELKTAQAELNWSDTRLESILIVDADSKPLQKIENTDWTNLIPSDRSRSDLLKQVDVNFDGIPDLLIESSSGSAGTQYEMFVFNEKTQIFERLQAFEKESGIWNPTFIVASKEIKAGPADMRQKTYRWRDNRLIEVTSIQFE